jgi:hypothetical protein
MVLLCWSEWDGATWDREHENMGRTKRRAEAWFLSGNWWGHDAILSSWGQRLLERSAQEFRSLVGCCWGTCKSWLADSPALFCFPMFCFSLFLHFFSNSSKEPVGKTVHGKLICPRPGNFGWPWESWIRIWKRMMRNEALKQRRPLSFSWLWTVILALPLTAPQLCPWAILCHSRDAAQGWAPRLLELEYFLPSVVNGWNKEGVTSRDSCTLRSFANRRDDGLKEARVAGVGDEESIRSGCPAGQGQGGAECPWGED